MRFPTPADLVGAFRPARAVPVTLTTDAAIAASYRAWQKRVLVFSIVGYAAFYFVRKNLGVAMPLMGQELGITNRVRPAVPRRHLVREARHQTRGWDGRGPHEHLRLREHGAVGLGPRRARRALRLGRRIRGAHRLRSARHRAVRGCVERKSARIREGDGAIRRPLDGGMASADVALGAPRGGVNASATPRYDARVRYGAAAVVALAVVAAAAPRAHAQVADLEPERIRVAYTAFAAACPDDAAFWERVTARAPGARRADAGEPSDVRAFTATLAPRGERVEGRLDVRDIDGTASTRTIEAATCDDAASALALVAALAIEERAAERAAAAPALAPAPTATPPIPPSQPAPARRPRWRVRVGTGVDVTVGRAPSALFGLALFVGLRRERADSTAGLTGPAFRLTLAWAPSGAIEADAQSAAFTWWTGRLEGCPVTWALSAGLHAEPCLVLEGGAVAANGRTTVDPRSATRPWLAGGANVRVTARIAAGVGVELGAAVLVPFVRDRFAFASGATVLQVPVIEGLFDAGLTWTIP